MEQKKVAALWFALALAIVITTLYHLSSGFPLLLLPASFALAGIAVLNGRQRMNKWKLQERLYSKLITLCTLVIMIFAGLDYFL